MIDREKVILSVTRKFIDNPSEREINSIIASQNGKCAFCEIDIQKHAKIHAEEEGEFVALCSICNGSQHIESLNGETDGVIIMLSDLTQVELISLSRTIEFLKRLDPEEYSEDIDSAIVIKILIEEGANSAERYFGEGSSDIELIAQALINQDDESYANREEGLYTMKWLPNYDSFKEEIDYWFGLLMKDESSPYHPLKWEGMMQEMKKKKKNQKKA